MRRAFTLIEVMISTVITSVLVVAMGSAVVLASHAIPNPESPTVSTLNAMEIAQDFAGEVAFAESILTSSEHVLEFTVPDRDGDQSAETIRYEWSGTPGHGLTRRLNDGAAETVLTDVREFALTYETTVVTQGGDVVPNESGETLLVGADPNGTSFSETTSDWAGQVIDPPLPDGVTEWSVTRVFVQAKRHGSTSGVMHVQLRDTLPDGLPGPTVLGQHTLLESTLTNSYAWVELAFDVSGLAPGDRLCVVVEGVSGSGRLGQFMQASGAGGMLETGSAGASWTSSASTALAYSVYGTTDSPVVTPGVDHELLDAVGIVIRAGDSDASRIETTAGILNEIEIGTTP